MRLAEGQPDSTGALRLIDRDLLPGQAEDAIAPAQKGKRRVLDVERAELPRGDDPVLPIREGREANIRWCLTLRAIIDGNVKHAARMTREPAHVARGLRRKWS
jgi:hypothetical protein